MSSSSVIGSDALLDRRTNQNLVSRPMSKFIVSTNYELIKNKTATNPPEQLLDDIDNDIVLLSKKVMKEIDDTQTVE